MLHRKYADQGLAVLGFPANEFGAQEPGTDEEISTFCTTKYGVKFDMFSKVVVKKLETSPARKGGLKVADVEELWKKLHEEAKVL